MKPDRWAQIDRLLDETLERAEDERAAFLVAACADDEELRREVESLLAAHDRAQGFLKKPALEIAAKDLAHQQHRSLIGKPLGPYQVLSALGKGGMGEVYLAQDTRLARKVALKLLPPEFTQEKERVQRFEREARAASGLNHPNILTIYEIGELDETHFIASEYIEGRTLREALAHGALPEKEVLDIGIQIAEALAAAHEAGIIHRDIKPENVMLRRDGYVKVLDFGLAKLTEAASSQFITRGSAQGNMKTNPGAILGTARYMSPEQALGEEVDRRTDLFSLGVLLYELAVGAPPFKGVTTPATLDAIVHHVPVPLTQLKPALQQELEHIVGRALEKERELRYQSATDLRADLKRLQRDLNSTPAQSASGRLPAPKLPPLEPDSRRRKHKIFGAVLCLVAVVAGFWWWRATFSARPLSPDWRAAFVKLQTDFPGEELFPSLAQDGLSIVYARWNKDNLDIYSQRVGGSNPQNLTSNSPENDTQPAFSPDGQYIAFRTERDGGGIFLMGASGESVRRLSEKGLAYHPAWSPDSSEVIYTEEPVENPRERSVKPSHLWAVNINTLQRRLIAEVDAAQPNWSPHGLRIAYCALAKNGQRNIWTMTAKGDQITAITSGAATDWNPVWAPDGQALYFVSDRAGSMQLWRVAIDEASGKPLGPPELIPAPAAYSQHPTLSRDGKRLAFVQMTPLYALHRYAFDAERGVLLGEPQPLLQNAKTMFSPDVSPDGKRLVYYASDGAQEDLFWLNSDGSGQPQQLTDDPAKDRAPRWSPDGKRLTFYSNRSGNWELWTLNADGSGLRQVTFASSPDQAAFFPTWSADGSKLLFMLRGLQPFSVGPYFIDANRSATTQAVPAFTQASQYPTFWARAWSPDRNLLAGASRDKAEAPALITYDMRTQQIRRVLETGDDVPQWLNDNRRLLVYRSRRLMLVDTQTRREQEVFSALPYQYNGYALSPDNRFLYLVMNLSEANICLLSLK
jgi:eukaryotic-like serine/threonine-protein kinase